MCAFRPEPRPELPLAKCDPEVVREFESIAKDLGVPPQKLEHGLWEIRTTLFTLRIRVGLGDWTEDRSAKGGLLVTMLRSSAPAPPSRLGFDYEHEIGLGLIAAHFSDSDIYQPKPIRSMEDFIAAVRHEASFVRQRCMRFLRGDEWEFPKIEAALAARVAESRAYWANVKWPPNVIPMWDNPPKA